MLSDYGRFKRPETVIHVIHLNHDPEAIQSEYDEAKSGSYALKEIVEILNNEQIWDAHMGC